MSSAENFTQSATCKRSGWPTDQIFNATRQLSHIEAAPLILRKHAYSDILKILPPKNEIFKIRNSDILHISAQNRDCGYSLEPPRRF